VYQDNFMRRFISALVDDSSSDEDEDLEGLEGVERPFNMRDVLRRLPPHWEAREVRGNHRKPCSECGKAHWYDGEYYFTARGNLAWGAEKICEDCITVRWTGCYIHSALTDWVLHTQCADRLMDWVLSYIVR
jgi:hypothetical protein